MHRDRKTLLFFYISQFPTGKSWLLCTETETHEPPAPGGSPASLHSTNSLCATRLHLLRPSLRTFAGRRHLLQPRPRHGATATPSRTHAHCACVGPGRSGRARPKVTDTGLSTWRASPSIPPHLFKETLTLITLEYVLSWAFPMGPNWCLPL